jgi:hypothetical protein
MLKNDAIAFNKHDYVRLKMTARWIAPLAILLVTFTIIGIFLWAVISPPPPPDEEPGTPVAAEKQVEGPDGRWTLAAQAIPRSDRTVAVIVTARDGAGRALEGGARPSAVLRMADMAMEDERLQLVEEGPGLWRGVARVSMAGRWTLDVRLRGQSLSLTFMAVSL